MVLNFDTTKNFFNQKELNFLKKKNKKPMFIEIGFLNNEKEFKQPTFYFFDKLKIIFSKKLSKQINQNNWERVVEPERIINVKINESKLIQIKISSCGFNFNSILNIWNYSFNYFNLYLVEAICKQTKKINFHVVLITNQSADKNFSTHSTFLFIWDLFKFKTINMKKKNKLIKIN